MDIKLTTINFKLTVINPPKLIHAYFGIDTETIYKAAKTNIPALKQPIPKMIKEQEKQ